MIFPSFVWEKEKFSLVKIFLSHFHILEKISIKFLRIFQFINEHYSISSLSLTLRHHSAPLVQTIHKKELSQKKKVYDVARKSLAIKIRWKTYAKRERERRKRENCIKESKREWNLHNNTNIVVWDSMCWLWYKTLPAVIYVQM